MKMTSFRAKPVGWRGESHRHYLAAKGVKTRYDARKVHISIERYVWADEMSKKTGIPRDEILAKYKKHMNDVYDKKHPNPFVTNEMVETEIESGSTLAHDVAANMGQNFDNVKHTAVFKKRVAEALKAGNVEGGQYFASKDKQKYFAGSASYDETDGSLKSRLVKRRGRLEAELKKLDHDDIRGDKLINEILDIEHSDEWRGLD